MTMIMMMMIFNVTTGLLCRKYYSCLCVVAVSVKKADAFHCVRSTVLRSALATTTVCVALHRRGD